MIQDTQTKNKAMSRLEYENEELLKTIRNYDETMATLRTKLLDVIENYQHNSERLVIQLQGTINLLEHL
jgi:predicted RNase H-like nuclease (RuvC/YqgF family)